MQPAAFGAVRAQVHLLGSYFQRAPGGRAWRGIADVVTAEGCVVDFKTSGRGPSGIGNAHRIQLTTYAELTGCSQAKIITITKAASPKVIAPSFSVLASEREHVRHLFPVIADAMAQGFAIPNRTSTIRCANYCSFWRRRQEDYGGAVGAAGSFSFHRAQRALRPCALPLQ